jgi:hypothetical protein
MKRLIGTLLIFTSFACEAGDGWSIDWFTISGGGAMDIQSGNWTLSGTIGQHDATAGQAVSGGSWQLTGGFWSLDFSPLVIDQIFRDRFEPAPEEPFSFSLQLAPTFRHARCETCHAVAATNFQRVNDDPPGVLPASHPIVNATTDCTACHTSALLPPTGTIDPGWQSAPPAFDFRGQDDASLCNMASQEVSGHTPFEHMTEDRLVLWAVGDGRVPFSATPLPTAPPNDIEQWRALIQQWVDAGMPCD